MSLNREQPMRPFLNELADAFETYEVPDGSIGTNELADGAVTNAKIANGAVNMDKLADDVLIPQPTDAQVTSAVNAALAAHPEWTTTVQDGSITDPKLAQGVRDKVEAVDEITSKLRFIRSRNWCEDDSSMTAGYVGLDGTVYTSTNLKYSRHIPVTVGDVIRVYGSVDGSFAQRPLRFVTAYDANDNAIPSSGTDSTYSYTVPSGVSSVVISTSNAIDYFITKNYIATFFEPYFIPHYVATTDFKRGAFQRYSRSRGAISDGGAMMAGGLTAIKDGLAIVFKGHLTTLDSISLNLVNMYNAVLNYVQVDATNVTIKNANTAMAPVAHGLNIQKDICIKLEFVNGQAKITITSNGETFTTTVSWYHSGATVSKPRIISTGTACDVATLEVAYPSASRGVWYFGDSYIGFTSADRWPYYLVEDGLSDNGLFSGAAGCSSASTSLAMDTLLNYGTPSVAVMATGMNDGSDGDTPPTLWVTQRDTFLALCQQNGVTPVFCTVPTVPTVNNEQKNAWVRASGYRYIDFAEAVGANASGEWYTGMLSSDGVHPTAKGARALYSQVLADLPEIFIPA